MPMTAKRPISITLPAPVLAAVVLAAAAPELTQAVEEEEVELPRRLRNRFQPPLLLLEPELEEEALVEAAGQADSLGEEDEPVDGAAARTPPKTEAGLPTEAALLADFL